MVISEPSDISTAQSHITSQCSCTLKSRAVNPPALQTMEEPENLGKHLGILDDLDPGGRSWDSILGALLAGNKRRHADLRDLALLNPLAMSGCLSLSNNHLCNNLPAGVRDVVINSETSRNTTTKEYQEVLNVFMGTDICGLQSCPEPVMAFLASMQQNSHVSHLM